MRFQQTKTWLDGAEEMQELRRAIAGGELPITVTEMAEAHLPFLLHTLEQTGFLVAPDAFTAKRLYEDAALFYGDRAVLFPERELIFHDVESFSKDVTSIRVGILHRLFRGERLLVVTTPSALLCPTLPPEAFAKALRFTIGERFAPEELPERMFMLGYKREEMVEGMGQFALRGGILDFYPFGAENPYRIEFFDDEVDSVRIFDPYTQRTLDTVEEGVAIPVSEVLLDEESRLRLLAAMGGQRDCARDRERLEERISFPGIDRYLPLLAGAYPYSYVEKPRFFLAEPQRIAESAELAENRLAETIAAMTEDGRFFPETENGYGLPYSTWVSQTEEIIGFSALSPKSDYRPKKLLSFPGRNQTPFHGKMDFLYSALRQYRREGYRLLILAGTPQKAKNLTEALLDEEIPAVYKEEAEDAPVLVTHGSLSGGFDFPTAKLAVISDREIFGEDKKPRRRVVNRRGERLGSFTDLSVGDYVVHQNHGVGQFVGMVSMEVDGATGDYLHIRFKGTDNLYVPAHQLDLLYKYTGKEGAAVRLNKLGGTEWLKTKLKVKQGCKDMADQLIALYAKRQATEGIAFAKDTEWQREFEEAFPYQETEDQLRCIDEVKRDMESPRPMERLLCGDVGYGKTEVALRAAFKAVTDGYQVAYLVPTTILAMQHYNTFCERMKDYPIKVEMLSRFRTPKQQKETIQRAKRGEVDVLIGTHRMIQKDLGFQKLGLLIIDEEQRFGVAHKEKIKELKANVDVLTLTATPIPRTLHMSLVGIRDMSVIENPPKDRYPVSTYVLEYRKDILREAVLREVGRGGQVYYLHNRVQHIEETAAEIAAFAPGLRVAVAHGQMSERQLEDIMAQMVDHEIDVLVCTTIIETGLDIPNVNTIIIENADHMGLSQLYQLRGRVGRSNRLAYAYLCYQRDKVLSEAAEKRLRAIREFTEFGSGFKIALRDLEIRGAGNLIGAQQHGHMDAVGYDMYCQLLGEAVAESRGEKVESPSSPTIHLRLDAYLPKSYVADEWQRIELYKKIAAIETEEDMGEMYDEICDRFGTPPKTAEQLLEVALISAYAKKSGVEEVRETESSVVFFLSHADIEAISALVSEMKGMILFSASERPYLTYRKQKGMPLLPNIKNILQRYKGLKNV